MRIFKPTWLIAHARRVFALRLCGSRFRCCVDFPQEPEDAYDLYKQYDWTEQMLGKTADQEAGASAEQEDGEVKLNSKKRKAASALDKRDKVLCMLTLLNTDNFHWSYKTKIILQT